MIFSWKLNPRRSEYDDTFWSVCLKKEKGFDGVGVALWIMRFIFDDFFIQFILDYLMDWSGIDGRQTM